jgi:hypothetical protein
MTAMTSAARISMFITLLLIWGGSSAFAQFSSGIEGTATESTGAVLAKATVTLTDTRLGVNKTTTTDQAGTSASTASARPRMTCKFNRVASNPGS